MFASSHESLMFSNNLYGLAFCAAALYSIATIFLKHSLASGCGVLQVNFFANLCIAILYQPFCFFAKPSFLLEYGGLPVCAGLSFMLGEVFKFLALRRGDISLVTPLQGTKILAVTFISALFLKQSIPNTWWWATGLSFLGILLVTGSEAMGLLIN